MRFDGATARGRSLEFSQEPFTTLPLTVLRWDYLDGAPAPSSGSDVRLPVYLNGTREELIFACVMQAPAGVSDSTVYGRGVALMCSSLSGIV
jgi:dynein heavy chain 1